MKIKKIPISLMNGERAFSKHQNIKDREQERRKLLAQNMIALVEMFETQEYRAVMGDDEASWSAYLSEIEVFYARGKVEKWRKIYKVLVEGCGIDLSELQILPESRLESLSKILTPEMDLKEWLNKAEILAPQDWKDEVAPFIGKPDSEHCQHNLETFEICSVCGLKHRINEEHRSE
jgi:hypothetical protein